MNSKKLENKPLWEDKPALAWDNFRMYFTDKQRGKVLRLSQDGLTPISDIGMKDWFGDNLKDAISNAYDIANRIDFDNKYFRTDIGKKGLEYK